MKLPQFLRLKFLIMAVVVLSVGGCAKAWSEAECSLPCALSYFTASGDMIENADGSASFEFRFANDHRDATVLSYTVSVTFYHERVSRERRLATYYWSFKSEVAPDSQILEFGVLDAAQVKKLRYLQAAARGSKPDAFLSDVYTFEVRADEVLPHPKI